MDEGVYTALSWSWPPASPLMSQLPVLVRSDADEGSVRPVVHDAPPAMETLTDPDGASGEPLGDATDTLTSSGGPPPPPGCWVPVMLVVVATCMTPANALAGASSALPARPPASTTAAVMPARR